MDYLSQADASYPSMSAVYSDPELAHPLIPPSRTRLFIFLSPCSSRISANQPAARVPLPRDDPIKRPNGPVNKILIDGIYED